MRSLVLLSTLFGCSLSVDYTGTFFQCGEGDLCPEGYVCRSEVCIPTEPTAQACSSALAAGSSHTCMVREGDGSVWCWGRNNQGQLGNGSIVDSEAPVQVTGITGATALAAGAEFTCAIVTGEVRCWGANVAGQLGDNSMTTARDPVSVSGLTGVTAIATGSQHTCVIAAGRAQCWGDNAAGQLGDTTTSGHRTPAPVSLTGNVTALAAAGSTSCAVVDGALACWGSNASGQFMTGVSDPNPQATPLVSANVSGVTQVAVGGGHVCVLAGNVVQCAGQNSAGQLGDGTATASSLPVEAFIPATIATLTAGGDNTCAVDGADRIWCWGSASEGKLFFGEGVSVSTTSPILTAFPPGAAIALGSAHSCVRTVAGAVSCAGANGQGQLGAGARTTETSPIPVEGLTDIVSIASGDRFTCAVSGDGVTQCWGLGSSGQLGDGGFQTRAKPVTSLVSQVDRIHAGAAYVCAEKTDGSIACWGSGGSGQLGDGTATRGTPVTIAGISNVDQLALGDNHTCEITGTTMRCWGDNNINKLGDAGTSGPDPITLNNGLIGPVSVAVAAGHTCVIDSVGKVQCWGDNNNGILGRGLGFGMFNPDTVPAPVKLRTDVMADLTGIVEIASRGTTMYARQGGLIFAWGGGTCPNILGASTASQCANDAAAQVDNISNAKKLAIGFSISCAVKQDDTISCWGQNTAGQIGDGTYNFAFPTSVPGLSGVAEVAPGSDHVCALKTDGTVVCWGNAANGQLANGVVDDRGPVFARLTCGE